MRYVIDHPHLAYSDSAKAEFRVFEDFRLARKEPAIEAALDAARAKYPGAIVRLDPTDGEAFYVTGVDATAPAISFEAGGERGWCRARKKASGRWLDR